MVKTISEALDLMEGSGRFSSAVMRLLKHGASKVSPSVLSIPSDLSVSTMTSMGFVLDNSPSMEEESEGQANYISLVQGVNSMWAALRDAKAARSTECILRRMHEGSSYNSRVFGDKEPTLISVVNMPDLRTGGFLEGGGTPLYRRLGQMLCSVGVRTFLLEEEANVQARGIVLVVTDGEDTEAIERDPGYDYSGEDPWFSPDQCASLVTGLASCGVSTLFWGLSNGRVDFRKIGRSLGIPAEAVEPIPTDPKVIRRRFQLLSQSISSGSSLTERPRVSPVPSSDAPPRGAPLSHDRPPSSEAGNDQPRLDLGFGSTNSGS